MCVWGEAEGGLWLWQCLSGVDRLTPSPRGQMKNLELRHYETGDHAWGATAPLYLLLQPMFTETGMS